MDIYCRKIIKKVTHVMIYWWDKFATYDTILPLSEYIWIEFRMRAARITLLKNWKNYEWVQVGVLPPILGPKVNGYGMKWIKMT
jgi:hypothetical protein